MFIDVKSNILRAENIDKDSKFKVADHVKISKLKNIFLKFCAPSWPED